MCKGFSGLRKFESIIKADKLSDFHKDFREKNTL